MYISRIWCRFGGWSATDSAGSRPFRCLRGNVTMVSITLLKMNNNAHVLYDYWLKYLNHANASQQTGHLLVCCIVYLSSHSYLFSIFFFEKVLLMLM